MPSGNSVPVDDFVKLQDQLRDATRVIAILVDRNGGSALIHASELMGPGYAVETSYDADDNLLIAVRASRPGTPT